MDSVQLNLLQLFYCPPLLYATVIISVECHCSDLWLNIFKLNLSIFTQGDWPLSKLSTEYPATLSSANKTVFKTFYLF